MAHPYDNDPRSGNAGASEHAAWDAGFVAGYDEAYHATKGDGGDNDGCGLFTVAFLLPLLGAAVGIAKCFT